MLGVGHGPNGPCCGREIARQDLGMRVLQRIERFTAKDAEVENEPFFEGRQVVMVAPR